MISNSFSFFIFIFKRDLYFSGIKIVNIIDVRFIFYYYSYYCKLEFMIDEMRKHFDFKVCRINNADNEKINDSQLFSHLQAESQEQTKLLLCFIFFVLSTLLELSKNL